MPTGEPPHKTKGSAPMYLPHKVVWKKYISNHVCNISIAIVSVIIVVEYAYWGTAT